MKSRNFPVLAAFVVLVLGGGTLIGIMTGPDAWFAALNKPAFNPPGWLFAPVWTVLYVLVAVAGWLVWRHRALPVAMGLWWVQLALNFLWSPLFFAMHRIDLALGVIVLLVLAIAGFIAATSRREPIAALLFVPYAAWVGFATVLNGAFWRLNGAG